MTTSDLFDPANTNQVFGTLNNPAKVKEYDKVRNLAFYIARNLVTRRLAKWEKSYQLTRLEMRVRIDQATRKVEVDIKDLACTDFPNGFQEEVIASLAGLAEGLTCEGDFEGTLRIRRNYADKMVYEVNV